MVQSIVGVVSVGVVVAAATADVIVVVVRKNPQVRCVLIRRDSTATAEKRERESSD